MNKLWTEHWRDARKKGRTHYVLRRGGLLGALMFVTLRFLPQYFDMVEGNGNLLVSAAVFLTLGMLIAVALWTLNERSYARQKDRPEQDAD